VASKTFDGCRAPITIDLQSGGFSTGVEGTMRRWISLAAAFALTSVAGTAQAQVTDVDLQLVLAVDVSRSMDYDEQKLQRDGYVEAFRHPEVIQAILSGLVGKIAVTYMEWAGPYHQQVLVPWTIIGNAAEAEAFASRLSAEPILRETGTSISAGLEAAAAQFGKSNVRAVRQTIDVSGDGPNNMGLPVVPVRDELIEQGITINGLPIVLKVENSYSMFNIPNLDVYYEDCVIGGPGAFMITVDDLQRFAAAVRRKLVLEIAGLPARVIPAAETFRQAPRIDCMIGENARRRWMDPMTK
jgi:hypothetical protein